MLKETIEIIINAFSPIETREAKRKIERAFRYWAMDGGCIGSDPFRMLRSGDYMRNRY